MNVSDQNDRKKIWNLLTFYLPASQLNKGEIGLSSRSCLACLIAIFAEFTCNGASRYVAHCF